MPDALAARTLAALPALAAPKVQVSTTNAVADHADILSDETEQYVNDVSIKLSDACGAQIGVYTLDELLGSTTMEGFAYDVFNAWGLGSDDLDNGVLLLLAPNEADGGDYYIMRGDGLESQLSFSTLGSLLDEYMEPYWVNGDYDTGTQKTVQALANRLGTPVFLFDDTYIEEVILQVTDLIRGKRSTEKRIKESFTVPTLNAAAGDLSLVLPKRILDGIIEMIYALDKVAPGTANDDTLLYGVEVKFYNMEVEVDSNLMTCHDGLYIIGDGSGITPSLSHASASGVHVARQISKQ